MTLLELKADAYDAMMQIELWRQKLQQVQNAITNFKPILNEKEKEEITIKEETK